MGRAVHRAVEVAARGAPWRLKGAAGRPPAPVLTERRDDFGLACWVGRDAALQP